MDCVSQAKTEAEKKNARNYSRLKRKSF
ncbi:CagY family CD-EC repeat-containing protein [Helicobacter pylori]|nr:CagY family CD-EC repeat-containing protein [Helicobacter pylori]